MKKIILSMEAGLIDDSIGAILSVPFCPRTLNLRLAEETENELLIIFISINIFSQYSITNDVHSAQ